MTLFENILRLSTDVPAKPEASADFLRSPEKSESEWIEAFRKTVSEGLVAYCLKAAESLGCPDGILRKWKTLSDEVSIISEINHTQTGLAADALRRLGIDAVPLKGAAVAEYYPEPSLRFYQDIDLWAKGPREVTLSKLGAGGFIPFEIISHECKVNLGTGVGIDVHFTPQKFNNPFYNRRLREYFDNIDTISTSFYLVYCLSHILRHTINENAAWKQILDYHFILTSAAPEEKSRAKAEILRLGMEGIARDVCWVLKEEFGDSTEDFFTPRPFGGKRLLEELRRPGQPGQNAISQRLGKTIRIASFILFYPSEAIFSPFARLKQYIWRKLNKF